VYRVYFINYFAYLLLFLMFLVLHSELNCGEIAVSYLSQIDLYMYETQICGRA
jgi:hypothetical protein